MSSANRRIVEESWDFLAASELPADNLVRDLPEFPSPHGSVLLSQDSEGARHLLVPIPASTLVTPDTDSQGVQLVKTSFIDKGRRRYFVDIRCPDSRLHRVFNQIASAMLDELATGEDPVPTTCARVLSSWRALLRRASRPLSPTALRGVFGELWFLARLAEQDSVAVAYWTGPDGTPQDFISAHGAFEIKTTLRNPARKVSISSIDQLDDQAHPFLTLVVLSVVEDPKGATLEDTIDTVVGMGAPRDHILDQLAKIGVQEGDLPETGNTRWRVASCASYRVGEGFPRLTPADVPASPGVSNLRYDIDLAAAIDFTLSDAELAARQHQFLKE